MEPLFEQLYTTPIQKENQLVLKDKSLVVFVIWYMDYLVLLIKKLFWYSFGDVSRYILYRQTLANTYSCLYLACFDQQRRGTVKEKSSRYFLYGSSSLSHKLKDELKDNY